MKIFGKIDQKEKVNIPLLIILSFIPFVCCYAFLRVQKFRKMMLINLATILIFVVYLVLRYDLANHASQVLDDIKWLNYAIIPIIDGILIYKWAKDWNQKLLT